MNRPADPPPGTTPRADLEQMLDRLSTSKDRWVQVGIEQRIG